jgi:phosphoribosylformylglycinamidine synthase subunit PurS
MRTPDGFDATAFSVALASVSGRLDAGSPRRWIPGKRHPDSARLVPPTTPKRRPIRRESSLERHRAKKGSPRFPGLPNIRTCGWRVEAPGMKAKIIITPKKAVVDPQGKTVQSALAHMGYDGVQAVHVGKYLEIELTGEDRENARTRLEEACHRFLSNPVIEDYRLEIE